MPERAALIAGLILERPLCFDCIAARSGLTVAEVEHYLVRVRTLVTLNEEHDRCRACGVSAEVISLDRIPA